MGNIDSRKEQGRDALFCYITSYSSSSGGNISLNSIEKLSSIVIFIVSSGPYTLSILYMSFL